jgi:hypothetical protein
MTPEVISKLEEGFCNNLNDLEACLYAGISKKTLYNYQAENPDFYARKELLKSNITMHAKHNVARSIKAGELQESKWHLERVAKQEYSTRQENLIQGDPDSPLSVAVEYIRPNADKTSDT